MNETFIQKDGNGKGNEVEVVKEEGHIITVRSVAIDFTWEISLKNFQLHFERKEDAKDTDSKG